MKKTHTKKHTRLAPFSEVTASIWTSSILKEALFVHNIRQRKQHLVGEKFLFTEVAVEDGKEDQKSPDHNDDHDLLVIVKLIPDLAGLWLDGSEVGALVEPLGEVTHLLGLGYSENEI